MDNKKEQTLDNKKVNIESKTIETATALRYEPGQDDAPLVVAAGKGDLARKIKELAKEQNIPIVQDPELAKTLHDLGTNVEIPVYLYEAVAKILAYVYEIDQRSKR